MRRSPRPLTSAAVALACAALTFAPAVPAAAHAEREVRFPDGSGSVPEYRDEGEAAEVLLVCTGGAADFARRIAGFPDGLRERNEELFQRCQESGYGHLQQAVDAVREPRTNIYVLPGHYTEEPSRGDPEGVCAALDRQEYDGGHYSYQLLRFADQRQCPHNQNLVAVLDVDHLQIEGTGADPEDVVVDAGFAKLNAIRADRSDGFYLRNLTAQRTNFNAVYIMEADGFVLDTVVGRWNDEYGFLTFAVDHGLYTACEAYGNGDSGIYPGSASDINADRGHEVDRYAVEITGCSSHDNLLGYSGTAGNSVWVHGNEFFHNSAGAAMDSLFSGHPGLPQDHALFEDNRIHDNNRDYYGHVRDGTCQRPSQERGYENGVVCPAVGLPTGTGVLVAGGNYNVFRGNRVYGHDRAGFQLLHVPGFVRGETGPAAQVDTSHHNSYLGNTFTASPDDGEPGNRLDVWWDGQGIGNCWQGDTGASLPRRLPECGAEPGEFVGPQTGRWLAPPVTFAGLYACGEYDLAEARVPGNCAWFGAEGVQRLDVQLALGGAVLVGLAGLALWWRHLGRSPLAAVTSVAGVVGLGLGAAAFDTADPTLPAVAATLEGAWLVALGLLLSHRRSKRALGRVTVVFGALALVRAVEASLLLLPWLPLPVEWLRLALGLVWVPWALFGPRTRRVRSEAPAAA